jgi:hypothetical protein
MPAAVLWLGGLFDPTVRELRETAYQFRRPFVLDSTAATARFGIEATGVDEALEETITAIRRTGEAPTGRP